MNTNSASAQSESSGKAESDRSCALPDGVRVGWVSEEARSVWEPRFGRITSMVGMLEREAVSAGLRACSWGYAGTEELARIARWGAEHGLACLPLSWEEKRQGYVAGGLDRKVAIEQLRLADTHIRYVIGDSKDVCRFADAYGAADHMAIGRMLGYPACCLNFFEDTWVAGSIDGTWQQLGAAGEERDSGMVVRGGAIAHTLHRHVGVRAVFHLPCSMHCEKSKGLAERHLELADSIGFGEEVAWTREILEWPVRWSARNAIAELVSPIHRTVARTDPGPGIRLARYEGQAYPDEGARGNRFPFRAEPCKPERVLEVYKKMGRLRNEVAVANGFGSYDAMLSAHQAVVRVAAAAKERLPADYRMRRTWDLGGGTGTLLVAIAEWFEQCPEMICVDRNAEALAIGRRAHGDSVRFVHADIIRMRAELADATNADVLILMPGRLLEQGHRYATELLAAVKRWPGMVIAYQYGDSQTAMPGLLSLAREWWTTRDVVVGGQHGFAVMPTLGDTMH